MKPSPRTFPLPPLQIGHHLSRPPIAVLQRHLNWLAELPKVGHVWDATGSILRVFNVIAMLARPQYAGSSWVLNCSISWKKPSIVPPARASLNNCFPALQERVNRGKLYCFTQRTTQRSTLFGCSYFFTDIDDCWCSEEPSRLFKFEFSYPVRLRVG